MDTIKILKVAKQFKGSLNAVEPHFVPKVVTRQMKIVDAINPRFQTTLTMFIPKLKVEHITPNIMLHIKNNAGKCMLRAKNPQELADLLRNIADTITNEEWTDKWDVITDISEHLIGENRLFLDAEFVDVDEFKKAIENGVKIG